MKAAAIGLVVFLNACTVITKKAAEAKDAEAVSKAGDQIAQFACLP